MANSVMAGEFDLKISDVPTLRFAAGTSCSMPADTDLTGIHLGAAVTRPLVQPDVGVDAAEKLNVLPKTHLNRDNRVLNT